MAIQEIWLGPTPMATELYINYGIQIYWLSYLAYHAADWRLQHKMVRAVLWCATSQDSTWPPDLRRIVLDNLPAGLALDPIISHLTHPGRCLVSLSSTYAPNPLRGLVSYSWLAPNPLRGLVYPPLLAPNLLRGLFSPNPL